MYTSRNVYEHIAQKTNDPIVERKTCRVSWTPFPIYQSDVAFYTKLSTSLPWYSSLDTESISLPTPTLCPEERQRRRLSFRNERKLYRRRCDATWEWMISMYSPDKPYNIYNQKYRWSDQWNPTDYGRKRDMTTTFTTQFKQLWHDIPQFCIYHPTQNSYNCDYSNYTLDSKNCYLWVSLGFCEDCFYCNSGNGSDSCIDCINFKNSTNCYQCIDISWCSHLSRSINCSECSNSSSLTDCIHCEFCIWCTNLQNKKYHVNNLPVTKEQFEKEHGHQFIPHQIQPNQFSIWSSWCYGNNSIYSHDSLFVFDVQEIEKSRYTCRSFTCSYAYDGYGVAWWAYTYEMVSGRWNNSLFAMYSYDTHHSYYTFSCFNSSHLFWCIWLRNASYCIFNKQYSKHEYETLVPKIIAQMQEAGERGEFFDPSLSPFWYNETVAQEYFPETQASLQEMSSYGYDRSTYSSDPIIPEWVTTLTGENVPADITTVTDDILKQVIICELSQRPFMIQKSELSFYRKHNISLPRLHPDTRHDHRMQLRPWRTLHLRTCDKTWEETISVHPEDVSYKVYWEKAYQKEVFW